MKFQKSSTMLCNSTPSFRQFLNQTLLHTDFYDFLTIKIST